MAAAPGKRSSESRVEMTQVVMPTDANVLGTAFGGKIMQWIDLCAAISAQRHARRPVVTASMDSLAFLSPVRIGHVAILRSQVNAVFHTSMEVGVQVWTEDPLTGERKKCCKAYTTFVALDHAGGRPVPLPPLLCEGVDELRREREAHARREGRLDLRRTLSPGNA